MKHNALTDRYGMLFWLRWILWFAGSFVASAIAWTSALRFFFGEIRGGELTLTWCVMVFGSWFLLVIPFMRKKEQIWKRLNDDRERAVDAWLLGMGVFIGCLVAATFLWTLILKEEVLLSSAISPKWLKAVFATWLLVMVPFLIFMYRKADEIFKTAQVRQPHAPLYKTISVEEEKRRLHAALVKKLSAVRPTLREGYLATLLFSDGKRVPNVFVHRGLVLGVYDKGHLDFDPAAATDAEIIPADSLPSFEESRWLRFQE